jgi:hypothetical protein
LNILRGHAVPPYNFTEQKILTQESLRAGATKGDVRLLRESNI